MLLKSKCGLFSCIHFQQAFSASVFNAAYRYRPFRYIGSSSGCLHPFLVPSSLKLSSVMIFSTPGLGKVAAMEDEVYTTRLMLGVFAAALSAFKPPLIAVGMTTFGSSPLSGDAT